MEKNLLYYPYINIPDNSWTIKSILYWDNVGIIVPEEFHWNPEKFKSYTVELLKTDLIEGMYVGQHIYELRAIDNVFFNLLEKKEFNLKERQDNFKNGNYLKIYREKFTDFLLRRLIDIKLAKMITNDYSRILIESDTAKLLMFYLATTLSLVKDYTPSTDNIDYLNLNFIDKKDSIKLNNIRQNLLDDLIPFPIKPNLSKLRKFKDKYHEELNSFRKLIEQYAYDISILPIEIQQEQKHKLIIEEINDKKEKVYKELQNNKLGKISFGTICGIGATAGGIAAGNFLFGTLALAGTILNEIKSYKDNSKVLKQKDFSYLALIDKNLTN